MCQSRRLGKRKASPGQEVSNGNKKPSKAVDNNILKYLIGSFSDFITQLFHTRH